jgi:hypothetical protein
LEAQTVMVVGVVGCIVIPQLTGCMLWRLGWAFIRGLEHQIV